MRSPLGVFKLTDRMIPSSPGKTCITLQQTTGFGGEVLKDPFKVADFQIFEILLHFERNCCPGRYSPRNRFQKWAVNCWDVRQVFELFFLSPIKAPGGKLTEDLLRRQWFCIRGKGSFISLGTFLKGLEFIFASISHVTVHNNLSVCVRDPMTL